MGLDGRRVVVTRRPEQAGRLSAALGAAGADVIELPTIRIEPPESWTEVDGSIRMMTSGSFDWVAFTSANAVEKFLSRLGCMPEEAFVSTKVAAVGPATRASLEAKGIGVDLVPDSYTGLSLARA
ncbi:MAG: uroporphyrinogen-III synthase, partial [Actinomycetota bacterium]